MATADVVELATKYGNELQGKYEDLRKRAVGLQEESQVKVAEWQQKAQTLVQETQPTVEGTIKEIQEGAQDMSPVEAAEHRYLLETYLWLGVCLFAMAAGTMLGAILAPILGLFVSSKALTFIITFFLIPAYLYLYQKKTPMGQEESHWFNIQAALALGMTFGFNFAGRNTLFFLPPHIFVPVGVTLAAGVLHLPDRMTFLGAALGSAVGLYFVYGMIMGLYVSYLFWMIVLLGAHAVDIQLKIMRLRKGRGQQGAEQVISLIICHAIYTVCYVLSSYSNEDIAEMQNQEAQQQKSR